MTQEALKMALPLLEDCVNSYRLKYERPAFDKAITAIKEALAQPEQEPAFYAHDGYLMTPERAKFLGFPLDSILALYTTPPQRTWVGLEGEEIRNLWEEVTKPDRSTMTMVTSFARAIEAKLKERNT